MLYFVESSQERLARLAVSAARPFSKCQDEVSGEVNAEW